MKRIKKIDHIYRLTWTMKKHPKGITKQEITTLRHPDLPVGACDAALLCSMIYHENGAFSVYFAGVDGRKVGKLNENLEDREWFKVWMLLASRLAQSKTLDKEKKALCDSVFEDIRSKLFGISKN